MKHWISALLCGVYLSLWAGAVWPHALEPGYLEIRETSQDDFRVFWRKPTVGQNPMAIDAILPETCMPRSGPDPRFDGRAWISQWQARCPEGLRGMRFEIGGLEKTQTDVLLRVQMLDGTGASVRITNDRPAYVLPEDQGPIAVLMEYTRLGIDHILEGLDHLLFVLALLLLIRNRVRLLGAITSFTLAHSITLIAAALGWLKIPAAPVESIIALSILFLAVEIYHSRPGHERLSERRPWLVAFAFGLLHGLGFAGALREIGLPEGDIVLALLGFNLGVEIGQLLFVAAVAILAALLAQVGLVLHKKGGLATRVAAYLIGTISAYWLIDRLVGMVA